MSKEPFKHTRTFLAILQEDWKGMLYEKDSKDLLLLVGVNREKLWIHRAVLQARCEKFRGAKIERNELALPTLDPGVMRNVEQYLYTAEIVITDVFQICPLLKICHRLGLSSSLQSYAMQCLEPLLTANNVCKIITQAHDNILSDHMEEHFVQSMWTVINLCLEFTITHNSDMLSSESFLELSQEVMIVLVSAKLQVSTEEILKALLRWARYQVGTSKLLQSDWTEEERYHVREHIDKVVKHIHVADGRMSPDSISDGIYGMLERYSWAENSLKRWAFPGSTILIDRLDLQAQLNKWCGNKRHQWTLLYQGSRDGFSANDFHTHCDGHNPTVIIMQSLSGHVFGGYSDVPWSSQYKRGKYISSHTAFLFSLVNPFLNTPPTQIKIQQPSYAINSHPLSGPIFGSGADLCVSNNCHFNDESYSNLPSSYSKDQTIGQAFLAGTKYFTVEDYEVYGMQ